MMKKGQVSMEFLIVAGIALLIFVTILGFSLYRKAEVRETEKYLGSNSECLKVSNIINEVYVGGNGTEVTTETNYLISFYNYSTVTIERISNRTLMGNKIAYLVSDCGPGLGKRIGNSWYFDEEAFNDFKEKLGADFYYQCSGWCNYFQEEKDGDTWNNCPRSYENHSIDKPLSELFANISHYDTVYLEDSHIEGSSGEIEEIKTLLKNWVSNEKILILSEHPFGLMSPPYQDDYEFAGMILHQKGNGWNHPATVVMEDSFFNLELGETMDIEEDSWIEEIITEEGGKVAESGVFTGTYSDSGGSYSDTFSNNNDYWYFGSDNSYYNITAYAELTYDISSLGISIDDINSLSFQITYCHDGSSSWWGASCDGDAAEGDVQGSQDVDIYNYSSGDWANIGALRTDDNGHEIEDVYIISQNFGDYVSDNEIKIRYKLDYYNGRWEDSWLVIDYAPLIIDYAGAPEEPEEKLKSIVEYDTNSNTAIGYWDYGNGKIFYFADFNANMLNESEKDFNEDILTELVSGAYYLISPGKREKSCSFYAKILPAYDMTGNLLIKNVNGVVVIENVY